MSKNIQTISFIFSSFSNWNSIKIFNTKIHFIFPYHVFAAKMVGIQEVVKLLILSSFFDLVWNCHTCPHNIPLRTVRSNNSTASCFQRVYYWVVYVCRVTVFKPKYHVILGKVILLSDLYFLERFQLCLARPVDNLEERSSLLHCLRSLALIRLNYFLSIWI